MQSTKTGETSSSPRSEGTPWIAVDGRGWTHIRIDISLLNDRRVKAPELAVYAGVVCHAELGTGEAFPSVDRLGAYAGLGRTSVKSALSKLEEWGYIRIEHRSGAASVFTVLRPPSLTESDELFPTWSPHDQVTRSPHGHLPGRQTATNKNQLTKQKEQHVDKSGGSSIAADRAAAYRDGRHCKPCDGTGLIEARMPNSTALIAGTCRSCEGSGVE